MMGSPGARSMIPAAALMVLAWLGSGPAAAGVRLATDQAVLDIDTRGGLPTNWESCADACASGRGVRQRLVGGEGGTVQWTGADAAALAEVNYAAVVTEAPASIVAVLTAPDPARAGQLLVQRYELSRATHALRLQLQARPGTGLRVATGAAFVPAPLPGFGAAFTDVEVVRVSDGGQDVLEIATDQALPVQAGAGEWLGIRQRFWAWLIRPGSAAGVTVSVPAGNQPQLDWQLDSGRADLTLYAGPVERSALRAVAPELTQLLFASIWEPLRWLCFGLLLLLDLIMRGLSSAGLAIILLSLAVKIILWPLTRIADGWQEEVNRIQSRIQPRIDDVRRRFKGEEAHNLTLQIYRDEGVHPLFTLKSLGGFAIQVPMFIAAFDMLADNFALSGRSFLWIGDLAAPDRFAALPFTLPFFGTDLNLLPAIMTLFTVLSALTQREASLTPALLKKQRRQLYLMAAGFFLLFYTFPAGMVLYWTANNVWHFLKVQALQLAGRR